MRSSSVCCLKNKEALGLVSIRNEASAGTGKKNAIRPMGLN